MPIHLPPLSRRRFIARSLLGGAGLVLGPRLFADSRSTNADSWALLSDIHIAADGKIVARKVNMTENLKGVSREVVALPERPAGVIVTGDCAFSSGETGDYAQVTALLEPIRGDQLPVCLALGNHDNRERFWDALQAEKAAKRPLADRQVSLIRSTHANWFVLDSLDKTLSTPGLLGSKQLDWLASALDANPDKPALVLIHHNPGMIDNTNGLKDTEALYAVIRPRKQVKAYIFGHTHAWSVTQDSSGIHLVNLPPVAFVFREGEPSGWVHATLQPKGLRLELRCLDLAHKDHGQVVNLDWRA